VLQRAVPTLGRARDVGQRTVSFREILLAAVATAATASGVRDGRGHVGVVGRSAALTLRSIVATTLTTLATSLTIRLRCLIRLLPGEVDGRRSARLHADTPTQTHEFTPTQTHEFTPTQTGRAR
jgi:hypothetical protein